jgi:fatty acid CoA ligase FadD9
LPACRYTGQINPTDFFTRLLAGLCYTGLAPGSFYADPSSDAAHFDGM